MKVLLAYDGSSCADAAISDLQIAALPNDTELLVATVAHNGWPPSEHSIAVLGQFGSPWNEVMKETGEIAARAASQIQSDFPQWKVSSEPLWGAPAETLRKTIEHVNPDLLVVGSHGRSAVGRLLLGSVSMNLVHYAHCSVRVVRPASAAPMGSLRILVALDGSPQADNALREVARRIWPAGTQVRVVSAIQTLVPEMAVLTSAVDAASFASEPAFKVVAEGDRKERIRLQKLSEDAASNLRFAGLDATAVALESNPQSAIIEEANRWRADAIFLGARGLGSMDRLFLGSVSSAVVAHARCTVEVVR